MRVSDSVAAGMRTVMADEQRDVIEILIHDHREVEQMFTELESLVGMSDDASRQRRGQHHSERQASTHRSPSS